MVIFYLLLLFALGIYSYSQIDLNLTLLRTQWFLDFQYWLIQLGYFDRQLSAIFYLGLVGLLSLLYVYFSFKAFKDKLLLREVRWLLLGLTVLGLLSYPAFSHDIFNYIFDARILLFHQTNPYTSTALMFPGDDWTRFMNWTHRTYPYGPAFLPLTLPFYLFGLGKFIPTLLVFKALMVGAYLGTSYFIYRIGKVRSLVLFALNPLIILEVVVSGHLDITMLFIALVGYWYLVHRRKMIALFWLAISAGIKYATGLFFPVFLWPKISERSRLLMLIGLGYLGALLQAGTHEVLPHYFIVPFGFSALSENKWVIYLMIAIAIVLLVVRYYPFIATGVWFPIKLIP